MIKVYQIYKIPHRLPRKLQEFKKKKPVEKKGNVIRIDIKV